MRYLAKSWNTAEIQDAFYPQKNEISNKKSSGKGNTCVLAPQQNNSFEKTQHNFMYASAINVD